ncbi:MAG: helix-turn-helix transcriptional regulator, partial [Kamptonema sp. SIO4C4]|nr:helix-turn-helix transcriptional regulator [Kamptonema sp. SIO4C4]
YGSMAIAISRANYEEWLRENNSVSQDSVFQDSLSDNLGQTSSDSEKIDTIPQQLGEGYIHCIQLREMTLYVYNYKLYHDLLIQEQQSCATNWEIGFNLSGYRNGKKTGETFLEWGTYTSEQPLDSITYAHDPLLKVDIHIHSAAHLYQFIQEELKALPSEIKKEIESRDRQSFDEINSITPTMRLALEGILRCPFQQRTRQLYLESKCLELISLKLEQIKGQKPQQTKARSLNPDDIERIHWAKAILIANPDNPPSLLELARQVSLNDYKLKQGFRQVFGTTVFGYLHQYRMEKARQLLLERQSTVKEVARAVGYANQSHFAAAFRKRFGVNPKSFLSSRQYF